MTHSTAGLHVLLELGLPPSCLQSGPVFPLLQQEHASPCRDVSSGQVSSSASGSTDSSHVEPRGTGQDLWSSSIWGLKY